MSQSARFEQRSRILTDLSISATAVRAFLLLDDQACGEDTIKIKQRRLAVLLGLAQRQLRSLMTELSSAGYLRVRRTITGNVYDFDRQKTAASNRQETAARTGNKLPLVLYRQERQQEIPLNPPPSGGPHCEVCNDSPNRITVRRDGREAVRQWCPACGGNRERRTA